MEDESSSSRNQRPEEDRALVPGLDPDLPDLDPDLEAAQDLVEAVTKEVAPNLEAEADRLHRKTALGAVQGNQILKNPWPRAKCKSDKQVEASIQAGRGLPTRMTTERMEIAILDLAPEIVEDLEADLDPEVQWKMETKNSNFFETKRKQTYNPLINFDMTKELLFHLCTFSSSTNENTYLCKLTFVIIITQQFYYLYYLYNI